MQQILTRAIVTIVTVFFLALIATTTTFAAGSATWNGNTINYDGDTYASKTADGTTPPGLNKNQLYYGFSEVTDIASGSGQSQVIYFPSGTANIKAAKSAKVVVYKLDGSGKYGSRISGPTDITLIPQASSPSSSQAGWSGNNLSFDGKTFTGDGTGPKIADGTTNPVLNKGTQYYQSRGSPDAVTGEATLHVLSFPANVDAKKATTATYTTFKVDGSGNIGAKTGTAKSVTVVPASVTTENPDGSETTGASSCLVDGLGWIVCPVANFLAWGMDNIFTMLRGFLEVQPLSTDSASPLYQAWNTIRSIANVAFVIAFMIIIYSQLTSVGLSSYGIKKMIPRLIIAAVLVNVSYYICAVAVDLSNIIGVGLQELLVGMRPDLEDGASFVPSWGSVTSAILSSGTGVAAGAVALGGIAIASGGSLGAALILLLPMLLGLLVAIIVALLVLASRQALIIILIIIAPIAFVAYLLPNTEKLFEKWRSIFVTMLVFFPIFALIFGRSQLAAFLIMQTASQAGDNSINVILLAMFVQVAPLVLTPLLVRFSGGIIGRIAGLVNNPSKGLIDQTRNWSKQQSEYMAARNMARTDPVRGRQLFRRFALGADQMRRSREDRTAAYKEASDARWTGTQTYSDIQQDLRYSQDQKTENTERVNLRYETSKNVAGQVQNLDLRVRQVKLETENAKAVSDVRWESDHSAPVAQARVQSRVLKDQVSAIHSTHDAEFEEFKSGRIGHLPPGGATGAMLNQSREDTRRLAINSLRAESAKRAVNEDFTKAIELNRNRDRIDGQLLQTYAGGVQGVTGAQRALAAAINAQSKAHSEAVANATAILTHGNYADNTITRIALGSNGGTRVVVTDDMREAAIAKIAGGANATEIVNLMRDLEINPSAANQDFRQTFVEALLPNGNKPKFAGAGILAAAKQGIAPAPGKARLDTWIAETINADKLGSADILVSQDRDYLEAVRDTLRNNLSTIPLSPQARATMKTSIQMAMTNPLYAGKIGERRAVLNDIDRLL